MKKNEIIVRKSVELKPPMMPNFISTERDGIKFPVADLTQTEAEDYGELMKQEFIRHWKKKVEVRKRF